MKEKIKKYWKEIFIIVLIIFSFSKCTQSCNRQQKLDKALTEIINKDSIIKSLEKDTLNKFNTICLLNERLNTANEKVNTANEREKVAIANAEAERAKENENKAKTNEKKAIVEMNRLQKIIKNKN